MSARRSAVVTQEGVRGTLHPNEEVAEGHVALRFGNQRVTVKSDLLELQEDGSFLLPFRLNDLTQEVVVPLAEERLEVKKLEHTRRVDVRKRVSEREETVEMPLTSTQVEVERIEIDKVVEGPVEIRTEGDTTIIPVLREQVVITKQLVLEAEIRVTKNQVTDTFKETLTLRREDVDVHYEGEADRVKGRGSSEK